MAEKRVAQIAGHLFPKGMLAGQVAIITGSGQGIGAEAANLFAKEGAKVVVQDIDAAKATAVAKAINDAGGQATAVPGDMLNAQYIDELVIAKEWGPSFGVRANTIAFGHILTRLTAAKEDGAFVTTPDGSKVALGIPQAQKQAAGATAHADIPLRRPGTATEAASVILAVASPLFSYVNGQTIMVTGGRNM
ncbi:hypothetical protein P7C71_g2395, partial [Lecanoromycetidae sp. Uapishka_2]